jgi:hypothetical protein
MNEESSIELFSSSSKTQNSPKNEFSLGRRLSTGTHSSVVKNFLPLPPPHFFYKEEQKQRHVEEE